MPETKGKAEEQQQQQQQPKPARRRRVKETPENIAKLKELRGYAPFIKNVVLTYKRQMTLEQWTKLNMLAELLESK